MTTNKELLKALKAIPDMKTIDRQILESEAGKKLYNDQELNDLFILEKSQAVPYIRGKRKDNNQPIVFLKFSKSPENEQLYYIYAEGRDALRAQDRYGSVKR